MKVTNISASVRYSKSLEPGEHKTVELSVEASLEPDDDWHQAQQDLYASLTAQLRTLWSRNGVVEYVSNGPEKAIQTPSTYEASSVLHGHYCQQHQTEFRQREKEGKVWYSHRTANGWCNER